MVKAPDKYGAISTLMRDAVLHETNKISFLGLKDVNPGLISAFSVTALLFAICLLIRILVISKFQLVPGKFQLVLETLVEEAHQTLERERTKMLREAQSEISDMVVSATEKIVLRSSASESFEQFLAAVERGGEIVFRLGKRLWEECLMYLVNQLMERNRLMTV